MSGFKCDGCRALHVPSLKYQSTGSRFDLIVPSNTRKIYVIISRFPVKPEKPIFFFFLGFCLVRRLRYINTPGRSRVLKVIPMSV